MFGWNKGRINRFHYRFKAMFRVNGMVELLNCVDELLCIRMYGREGLSPFFGEFFKFNVRE